MKILRNYILKDFFSAFTFSLAIFSMVMLLGNLMKISDMIIRKGVDIVDALKIFSFFIPYLLGFTLPLSFLLAVLLTMGRLIADNEITAINTAGISLFKILGVFLILGIIFSLFLFILNDRVIPDFHYRYYSQIKNIYSKNITALIEPRMFLEHFRNHIIYVSDKNGNKLKNVFIYELGEKKKVNKITFAKRGEFIADNNILKLKLEDVFYHEIDSKDKKDFRGTFEVFFKDIPMEEKKSVRVEKKPSDMRLKELREKIKYLKKMGIDPVKLIGEFHKRISFSFSIITFAILGFGASLAIKHREKSINFGIAFLAAGAYYLLFILGEALLEYHIILPFLGMWFPNIAVISTGGYFLYRNAHSR